MVDCIQTSVFCQLGIGQSRARIVAPQEVSLLVALDLRPASPPSKIAADLARLRPNGSPAVPWWVRGFVEGYVSRAGSRNQGSEDIFEERLPQGQKSRLHETPLASCVLTD